MRFGQSSAANGGSAGFHAISLENPGWRSWTPGQYVMVRPVHGGDILAAPLPICRVTPRGLVLFWGADSPHDSLARLKSGDMVILWGPLGRGFTAEPGKDTLLLAYGEGIAPFSGYAECHPDPSRLFLLFGHPHPSECYPVDALSSRIDMEDMLDDGGEKRPLFYGEVFRRMEHCRGHGGMCLACGPMDFLRKVWRFARGLHLPAQLSLEKKIVCGTGACMGCATAARQHGEVATCSGQPMRACIDGPVFWASEIDLDAERREGEA
jgi:dihydroorotate dehydrogenase electron transfer subunit